MDKQYYMVVIKKGNMHIPIKNDDNIINFFESLEEAEEERIYLQPEYDELLKVFKI